jgi:UDP-2,4-diacetamido-2,4,6-trideoxy-beta-L-altropyranose hydrolase
MRIAFRVDAGHEIGSGHFFRCLALADGLAAAGDTCILVSRGLPESLRDRAERQGHQVVPLPAQQPFAARPGDTAHAAWLGAAWEDDADATSAALIPGVDWLVIDHYAIDRRWEGRAAPAAGHVLVIDDLADRPHECTILIDQNLCPRSRQRYRALVPKDCETLLGPRHALLREQFTARRKAGIRRHRRVERILVFLGGSDPANFTAVAVDGLKRLDPPVQAEIVIGSGNRQRDLIAASCAGDERFRVEGDVENMADLLAAADLAIGAAGVSSWERACLGLPAVIVTLAANQEGPAQELARRGLVRLLGRAGEVGPGDVAQAIEALRDDPAELARMGRAAAGIVDGGGVNRVVNAMRARLISLRRAEAADAGRLIAWRNDPVTRQYSLQTEPVARAEHEAWLAATLRDPDHLLLVGAIGAEPVGTVRFDRLADGARRVSITVSPDRRGRGLGRALLHAACREVAPSRLVAEIRDDNAASKRLFRGCGFRRTSHDKDRGIGIYTARIGRG